MRPSDLPPSRRLNQDMRCAAGGGRQGLAGQWTGYAGAKLIPERVGRQRRSRVPRTHRASRTPAGGLICPLSPPSGASMSPRRTTVEQSKGVFEVEWPLFGELSRALALKVVRDYDPEIIVGVATA